MSSCKKLTCKGTLRQVFICLRPPPLLVFCLGWSVYIFTQKRQKRGTGGGRVEPERRGEGQQGGVEITNLGWKYQHDWTYARNCLSPVYKLWYTPAVKSLYRSNFRRRHFALTSTSLIFLRPHPTPDTHSGKLFYKMLVAGCEFTWKSRLIGPLSPKYRSS